MGAYKDKNGTWYAQFRFTNWKGEPDRKTKRGFATKREALDWERDFLTQSSGNLEMTFEAFYELYKKNMKERIKLSTWNMKESVIEGKILPYFKRKRMCDIKPRDVVEWQNTLIKTGNENGEPYSPVYLKTIHNQLSAIFNHAVKFYDLPSNPARKAGNMGKEKSREMLFWTQSEYKAFSEAIMDKPISFYAFEVLYWGGLRLGEMLALTKKDIDFKRGIPDCLFCEQAHSEKIIATANSTLIVFFIFCPPIKTIISNLLAANSILCCLRTASPQGIAA